MADIDMIPRSYRNTLRVRRMLSAYGAALALLVVAGGGASLVLRWRLAVETPRLEQLRASSALAGAMRTQLAGAQQRKDALAGDVEAFAALRGGGEVGALAQVLESTLNDKVWIEQLRFSRTQELLRDPLPSPLPPGTVQAKGASGAVQAWQLGSHIELSGQALDHGAMTRFLSPLAADPALARVRFLNSSAITKSATEDGETVAFGAAASLVKKREAP
jgi:Tfp pilus assembly protein PilN